MHYIEIPKSLMMNKAQSVEQWKHRKSSRLSLAGVYQGAKCQ